MTYHLLTLAAYNKQASDEQVMQNAEENQQHSVTDASENDELLTAPTKERHADVAPRSNDDKRKDSDVWIEIVSFGKNFGKSWVQKSTKLTKF